MAFLFAPSGERLHIRAILAVDSSGVIGYDNHIVFQNPADLVFFQRTTMRNICVMGRKTFESIGKILKNRQTVILTKHIAKTQEMLKAYKVPDGTPEPIVVSNFEKDVPKVCDDVGCYKVFICGGAQLYTTFARYCSSFLVTRYMISVEDQVAKEMKRIAEVKAENRQREKQYHCKDFNLPTTALPTFIPCDYSEELITRIDNRIFNNLQCNMVETGHFEGVRYTIRSYFRGALPQPKDINETERRNRAKYRMESAQITEHDLKDGMLK